MVVAILGPTASGKSDLGLALAERCSGEIVCCDSMQVYRGMDIGTGKPSAEEQARCPHHLLDLVDPGEPFHAASWADRALSVIEEIRTRGHLPIIVGGTGLYFRALRDGLFEAPPSDLGIRLRHQAEAATHGLPALYQRLKEVDPEAAARIMSGDLVRISRALEIYEQTGVPISELRRRAARPPLPWRLFIVVLDYPLDNLRPRIHRRIEQMMATGFLDEVRALRQAGFGATRALAALGYKQLGRHLDGLVTLEEAVAQTKATTCAYARRQRTWFRREQAQVRAAEPPDPDALALNLATQL
jgi:tRNA dimethylallyltransferase